jgi:hypothetical protein
MRRREAPLTVADCSARSSRGAAVATPWPSSHPPQHTEEPIPASDGGGGGGGGGGGDATPTCAALIHSQVRMRAHPVSTSCPVVLVRPRLQERYIPGYDLCRYLTLLVAFVIFKLNRNRQQRRGTHRRVHSYRLVAPNLSHQTGEPVRTRRR